MNARLVVLVSGAGTNLQAMLDVCADPGYGATVVAVGADRDSITALDRAEDADVPTFTLKIKDFATRDDWDQALPALLPSFPGMHGVRDALAYGVKVSGCTVFLVDEGVDAGPVLAQAAVPVRDDDDEATLHERIKVAERALLVDTVGRMAREGWSVHEDRKVRIGK